MRQKDLIIVALVLATLTLGAGSASAQSRNSGGVRPLLFLDFPFFPGNYGNYYNPITTYGGYLSGGYPGGVYTPGYYSGYWATYRVIPGWGASTGPSDTSRIRPTLTPALAVPADSPLLLVAAVPTDSRATVVIQVPDSQAMVWVEGVFTRQQGTTRTFSTPLLHGDTHYVYDIQAQWTDRNGRLRIARKTVNFQAGELVSVTFSK